MRLSILLIAIVAGLTISVPSAGAIDDCPLPNSTNFGCGGGDETPTGELLVDVSTTPAGTVAAPAWDDGNLTYTVKVTNTDEMHDATGVVITGATTQGSATFVSSSTDTGSCSAMTCNIGTVAANEIATVT